jgi:hypothetical protein
LDGRIQLRGEDHSIADFRLAFRETKGGRFESLAQLLTAGLERGDLSLHRLVLAKSGGSEQRFRRIRNPADFFAYCIGQVRYQQLQPQAHFHRQLERAFVRIHIP